MTIQREYIELLHSLRLRTAETKVREQEYAWSNNWPEKEAEFNLLQTWGFILLSTLPQRGQNELLKHTYQLSDFKMKTQMIANANKGPILVRKLLWEN